MSLASCSLYKTNFPCLQNCTYCMHGEKVKGTRCFQVHHDMFLSFLFCPSPFYWCAPSFMSCSPMTPAATDKLPACLYFSPSIKHISGCRWVWYYLVRLCCISVAQRLLEMISISPPLPLCLLLSDLYYLYCFYLFSRCEEMGEKI